MKHLFVPYELALLAKEKGFNESCLGFFLFDKQLQLVVNDSNTNSYWKDSKTKEVSAPLYQQLGDWFRDKHGLFIEIDQEYIEQNEAPSCLGYAYSIHDKVDKCLTYWHSRGYSEDYYKTFNKALTEAFKLI